MQTKREWRSKAWRSAAQFLLGGIGLALLTFVCFQLGLRAATAAFAYLILVVLLALAGSFFGSIVLSIVAVGCLRYFLAPPLFSFQVSDPDDALAIAAFLTTSIIVAGLSAKVRKMAEDAQAAQKALVDTIPAMVWSALPDGSRDFHSQRWREFTGLSAEEASGKAWSTVLHPQERAAVLEKWELAVATGNSFEFEARARSAKGEYRWVLGRAEPLRDEKGNIVKWYGSNTDIEDRKRATEALRESEEQWREVFEHNPVMYFMVDATGTVLLVNAFGAAQLGYAVNELVGQSVLKVFFEEDHELVRQNVVVCVEELEKSHSWEIRKVRKDGTVLWVRENAKAVRRAKDQLVILIACEDVTERKVAENALRQSEMYLAEAQKVSRTGSFGWHVATGKLIWSDETFRIFEYERAMKPTLDLLLQRTHPEDRASVQRLIERVSHDGADWDFEHRLLVPDGSVKYVRVVAHAVPDASGKLEFIGAVMDVTATRRADDELYQARAQLAHISRVTTLGELTASIAHEVNQPLAGVVSSGNACLHWLASQPPDVEKARQSVERIIRDANRASEVVGRVRGLAKKAPPHKVWLNLNETVLEVIALTRREIEQSHVLLRTQLSDDLPLVWADRIQSQQVILNLVVNAIEAVGIVSDGPRDLLVSSVKDKANGVLVTVRDTGIGLDPGKLESIFDAFHTTKINGMGMGLAVSRSIIEAHGGRLWATPNELRGAAFQFTLPIQSEEAA
jgi:PAS domain S-box-containing protein